MDFLLRRLMRSAARRGMRGDHWAWFVLAGGAFLLRRFRRQEDPVVFSKTVVPGDRFMVSVRSPKSQPADTASSS